jgi:hypothetical protein
MRVSCLFLCLVIAIGISTTAAFIFGDPNKKYAAFPGLDKLTEKQKGASLQISLVIEKPHSSSSSSSSNTLAKFALDGLQVELLAEPLMAASSSSSSSSSNGNIQTMPGANGPSPQFSSGKRALQVRQNPSYIDKNGLQTVALENGCWELVWREGDICGNLICGFDVPYEVSYSNGACCFVYSIYTIIIAYSIGTKLLLIVIRFNEIVNKHPSPKVVCTLPFSYGRKPN